MNPSISDKLDHLHDRYGRTLSLHLARRRVVARILAWKGIRLLNQSLKRLMDMVGALAFLIVFSPIYLITALAIVIEDGRPIFYNQIRVGRRGRLFRMYKFRSMYRDADARKQELESDEMTGGVIFKMKNDPRITRTGRIIRKLSIDELPQLWNVLKGDLSLVGPRPPLPAEVAEYSHLDRKRLEVTQGLTCTWQVSGRSDIDFENQVQLDIDYIKQRSFLADVRLLLKTVPAVITGKGAY